MVIFGGAKWPFLHIFQTARRRRKKSWVFSGAQWCNIYTFFRQPAAGEKTFEVFWGQYGAIDTHLPHLFVLCPIFFVRSFFIFPLTLSADGRGTLLPCSWGESWLYPAMNLQSATKLRHQIRILTCVVQRPKFIYYFCEYVPGCNFNLWFYSQVVLNFFENYRD